MVNGLKVKDSRSIDFTDVKLARELVIRHSLWRSKACSYNLGVSPQLLKNFAYNVQTTIINQRIITSKLIDLFRGRL